MELNEIFFIQETQINLESQLKSELSSTNQFNKLSQKGILSPK